MTQFTNETLYKYVCRYRTYEELCGYLQRNEVHSSKILRLVEELREMCIGLSEHHPSELIDEAVVLCLRMFMLQHKVTMKHTLNLRTMFGCVSQDTINKIFLVSLNLIIPT